MSISAAFLTSPTSRLYVTKLSHIASARISGINSSQMDIFLAEYKKAGIEPIGCKAVVTPDNVFWSADKLFREIFREHLFMNR